MRTWLILAENRQANGATVPEGQLIVTNFERQSGQVEGEYHVRPT
jgi:hypothetical protein